MHGHVTFYGIQTFFRRFEVKIFTLTYNKTIYADQNLNSYHISHLSHITSNLNLHNRIIELT